MRPIPSRVIDRVLTNAGSDGDCVVSFYSRGSHGYCQVGWHENGRRVMTLVHRVAWVAHFGPIPDGMTVDHLCHNRRCIEPTHLRLLTNIENARDNRAAEREARKRAARAA